MESGVSLFVESYQEKLTAIEQQLKTVDTTSYNDCLGLLCAFGEVDLVIDNLYYTILGRQNVHSNKVLADLAITPPSRIELIPLKDTIGKMFERAKIVFATLEKLQEGFTETPPSPLPQEHHKIAISLLQAEAAIKAQRAARNSCQEPPPQHKPGVSFAKKGFWNK